MVRKTESTKEPAEATHASPEAPSAPEAKTAHETEVARRGVLPATAGGSQASGRGLVIAETVACRHCSGPNPVSARFCNLCGKVMPDRFEGARRDVLLRVRAKKMGFFDNKRYREDDVFVLPPPAPGQRDQFSDEWMELVSDTTPERVTTGQQAIRKQHDETLSSGSRMPTGGQEVL